MTIKAIEVVTTTGGDSSSFYRLDPPWFVRVAVWTILRWTAGPVGYRPVASSTCINLKEK